MSTTLTDEKIKNKTIKLVRALIKNGEKKSIPLDSNFLHDLGMEYITFVDMIMIVEDFFEINFEHEEYQNINTLEQLINLIKTKY